MATRFMTKLAPNDRDHPNFVVPTLVLWAIVAAAVISFIWIDNELGTFMQGFYLLPWSCLTAICVLAPSAYLLYQGKFDLFHPLVFAAWSYIFPAFVIGSILVAFGWVDPYFLSFIEDPQYNFPLTLVYISIGFIGMTAGFFLPVGRRLADWIEPRLPTWQWRPAEMWLPGILLLLCGVAFNIIGFIQGLVGYQRNIEISSFDGLLFSLLTLLTEGTVLLWLAVFSSRQKTGAYYLVIATLIIFVPLRMALLGSR